MAIVSLFSIKLPNVKTVARDSLGNERTFLAWLRTSLILVSTGIALLQFNRFLEKEAQIHLGRVTITIAPPEHPITGSKPIAVASIVLGIITLVTGFIRFHLIQYFLQRNQFPVARTSTTLMLLISLATAGLYLGSTARAEY